MPTSSADALDSIRAQTHPVLEVLVVDGASSDDTVAVAEAGGAVVLAQRGPTLADAFNEGTLAARGTHIAFLSHDDVWEPDKLERQLRLLAENPDAAAVIGLVRFELADGVTAPPGFRPELLTGVHRAPIMETLLVPRQTLERVGLFRPEVALAADTDWYARLSDLGLALVTVEEVVLTKRITVVSTSHVAPGAAQDLHEGTAGVGRAQAGRAVSRTRSRRGGQRVSIVVPVRDGERFLAAALTSLLEGVRPPDEIVVVDDGSADALGRDRPRARRHGRRQHRRRARSRAQHRSRRDDRCSWSASSTPTTSPPRAG